MSLKREIFISVSAVLIVALMVVVSVGLWLRRGLPKKAIYTYTRILPCECGVPGGEPFGHRSVDAEMDWESCTVLRVHANENGFAVPMQGTGYAMFEAQYFEEGEWSWEYRYLQADGTPSLEGTVPEAPVMRQKGLPAAGAVGKYYFDAEGRPSDLPGYWFLVEDYDAERRHITTRFFGLDGESVMARGWKAHRIEYIYAGDTRTAARDYDAEGKLLRTRDITE